MALTKKQIATWGKRLDSANTDADLARDLWELARQLANQNEELWADLVRLLQPWTEAHASLLGSDAQVVYWQGRLAANTSNADRARTLGDLARKLATQDVALWADLVRLLRPWTQAHMS
ncbi:hypothetical protein ACFV3E_36705 [Streptomyces sp. NPDC059718]